MLVHGLADMLYVGAPCLAGVILLAGAGYQMVKSRKWWFAIPALIGACSVMTLVLLWFSPPEATEGISICPGVVGFILLGVLAYFVMAQSARKSIAAAAPVQPTTPPADPPPAPPS